MKKTYKREVAACCLIILMMFGVLASLGDLLGYEATNTLAVLEALVLPVMAFVGGMFGIDSYAKQINHLPPDYPPDVAPPYPGFDDA